jgi:hypothetical protein
LNGFALSIIGLVGVVDFFIFVANGIGFLADPAGILGIGFFITHTA